jgi:hypothetical protein
VQQPGELVWRQADVTGHVLEPAGAEPGVVLPLAQRRLPLLLIGRQRLAEFAVLPQAAGQGNGVLDRQCRAGPDAEVRSPAHR